MALAQQMRVGNSFYYAYVSSHPVLFKNKKIINYATQNIDGFLVEGIQDFFVYRNGDFDVLLNGVANVPKGVVYPGLGRRDQILLHNGSVIFDSNKLLSEGKDFSFSTSSGFLKIKGSPDIYFYTYQQRDGKWHYLKNGREEVNFADLPKDPNATVLDVKNRGDLARKLNISYPYVLNGCSGNDKAQYVCQASSESDKPRFLVRHDGHILPSKGLPIALNNKSKILTLTASSFDLLDYDKDASERKHVFSPQDYEAHHLNIPYDDSKGKLKRLARLQSLDDHGHIQILISNYSGKEKELFLGTPKQ